MTATQMKSFLNARGIHPDTLSFKKGVYTARHSYFWGITKSSQPFAEKYELIDGIKVTEHDNIFKAFRGEASVANQSHFLVRFTSSLLISSYNQEVVEKISELEAEQAVITENWLS
jgi:hypothetical protein